MKKILAGLCLSLSLLSCTNAEDSELSIVRGRDPNPSGPTLLSTVKLEAGGSLCTGSVIAPRLILTAAHCFENMEASQIQVIFSRLPSVADNYAQTPVRRTTFKKNGAAHFPNFDIALLELAKDIPPAYQPAEILRDPSVLTAETPVLLAGFGRQSDDCMSDLCLGILKEVNTRFSTYFDEPHLQSLLVFHGPESAGFGGACQGDSGGPAYVQVNGKWYLTGVTNGTDALILGTYRILCDSGWDIYTFAGDYTSWLEEVSGQTLNRSPENRERANEPRVVSGPREATPETWDEWMRSSNHEDSSWAIVDNVIRQAALRRPVEQGLSFLKDNATTQADLDQITDLTLDGPMVTRIDSLKFLRNLRRLILNKTEVKDLTPLRDLKNLQILAITRGEQLDSGMLNSMGPLRSQLKNVYLTGFAGQDLDATDFSAFTSSEYLKISDVVGSWNPNTLSDRLSKTVKTLDLENVGPVSNFVIGSSLESLSFVDATGQTIDLNVKDASKLGSLRLDGVRLKDESLLKAFPAMTALALVNLELTSLPTEIPASLDTLDISNNNFRTLPNSISINFLYALDNPLDSKACPANRNCFTSKHLKPRSIREYCENALDSILFRRPAYYDTLEGIQAMEGYPGLNCDAISYFMQNAQKLGPFNFPVKDLRPFTVVTGLNSLDLSGQDNLKLAPLAQATNLRTLNLRRSTLSRTEDLAKLTQIENLDLSESASSSLQFAHPKLRTLTIGGTETQALSDLSVDAPALRTLNVRFATLKDWGTRINAPQLSRLTLEKTDMSAIGATGRNLKLEVVLDPNIEFCPFLATQCQQRQDRTFKTLPGITLGFESRPLSVMGSEYSMTLPGVGKSFR